jgi:hypothetical protein
MPNTIPQGGDPSLVVSQIGAYAVRAVGIGLVLFGTYLCYLVVTEAWDLYRDPSQRAVERMAGVIEKGAHIDETLRNLVEFADNERREKRQQQAVKDRRGEPRASDPRPGESAPVPTSSEPSLTVGRTSVPIPLSLTYVLAWVVVVTLLLIIGRLSLSVLRIGAEIALHDRHGKRIARELLAEALMEAEKRRASP